MDRASAYTIEPCHADTHYGRKEAVRHQHSIGSCIHGTCKEQTCLGTCRFVRLAGSLTPGRSLASEAEKKSSTTP